MAQSATPQAQPGKVSNFVHYSIPHYINTIVQFMLKNSLVSFLYISNTGDINSQRSLSFHVMSLMWCRGRDVVKTFLHALAVGSYPRLFEALSSMLSRNTLNPADISIVSPCENFALFGLSLFLLMSWC